MDHQPHQGSDGPRLSTLSAPADLSENGLDIVAVHGLNPHHTWTHEKQSINWIHDFLPCLSDEFPGSRILCFGYDTLFKELENSRCLPESENRPIIFIAHSMHSIVIKQALAFASLGTHAFSKPIWDCTKGVAFFGTPSFGAASSSELSSQVALQKVEGLSIENPKPTLFKNESSNIVDQAFTHHVVQNASNIQITYFFDETDLGSINIVRDLWPRLDNLSMIPIRMDHTTYSTDGVCYKRVIGEIRKMLSAVVTWPVKLSKVDEGCLKRLLVPDTSLLERSSFPVVDGTFDWLRKHSMYRSWREDTRAILWIKGKPGCGKSVLMDNLRERIGEDEQKHQILTVAFFSFHHGRVMRETANDLYRALLFQVLKMVPMAFSDFIRTSKSNQWISAVPGTQVQLDDEELRSHLWQVLSVATTFSPIWVLVDALDECSDGMNGIVDFLSHLLTSRTVPGNLHICVSSRYSPELSALHWPVIHLDQENSGDIEAYLRVKLPQIPQAGCLKMEFDGNSCTPRACGQQQSKSYFQSIINSVVERAQGVFLWVRLTLTSLADSDRPICQCHDAMRIQTVLSALPTDLDQFYEKIILRMKLGNPSDSVLSQKILQWVTFAVKPLSLEELEIAIAFDLHTSSESLWAYGSVGMLAETELTRRLSKLGGGLVEVVPLHSGSKEPGQTGTSSWQVRLIHRSINDFLLGKGYRMLASNSKTTDNDVGLAHSQLAQICLVYLEYAETNGHSLQNVQELMSEFPFLKYAVMFWPDHAQIAEMKGVSQAYLLDAFHWPSNDATLRWLHMYRIFSGEEKHPQFERTSLLHAGSKYGLTSLCQAITLQLLPADDLERTDDFGWTPLQLAAQEGHEAVVRLLLDRGARIDIEEAQYRHTAMSLAAACGHLNIFALLLKRTVQFLGRWAGGVAVALGTALVFAASAGRESVVKMLIEFRVLAKSKSIHIQQALVSAAIGGHSNIIHILLARGVDPNSRDCALGQSALSLAAAYGHDSIVHLLLKQGADPNAKDLCSGHVPLFHAVSHRYVALAKLLIKFGATAELAHASSCLTRCPWAVRVIMALVEESQCNQPSGMKVCGKGRSSAGHGDQLCGTGLIPDRGDGSDRKRTQENWDSQGDDAGSYANKRPRSNSAQGNPASEGLRFACPFLVRYPKKYRNICKGHEYPTVHRLKGHIYRRHLVKFCGWCWQSFSNDDDVEVHQRDGPKCLKRTRTDYSEGIDSAQEAQLKCRAGLRGKSEEEKWIQMYKIVFPDVNEADLPSSTCYDECATYDNYCFDERYKDPIWRTSIQSMLAPGVSFEQFMETLQNDQQIRRDEFRQIHNRLTPVTALPQEPDSLLVAGSDPVMPDTPSILHEDQFERPPAASVDPPQAVGRHQNSGAMPVHFGQGANLPVVPNLAGIPPAFVHSTQSDSGFMSQVSDSSCLQAVGEPLMSQQAFVYAPAHAPQHYSLYHPRSQPDPWLDNHGGSDSWPYSWPHPGASNFSSDFSQ